MNILNSKKIFAGILSLCMVLQPFASGIPAVHAAEEDTGVVINATDYGADPTGKEDSTQAIQRAFAAAKEATKEGASSVTVSFEKGEYQIYKDHAEKREYHTSNTNSIENPVKTIGILIEDQNNFTLDGNDSLFMIHGNMMALAVVHSTNVTLKDFSWDFGVPTVSEMTVEAMGTENGKPYTDFLIPECFPHEISGTTIKWYSERSPYTGNYYWTQTGYHDPNYGMVAYQPGGEMSRNYYTSDGPFTGVSSIRELDSTHVRIVYGYSRPSTQEIGTVFELTANAHRETAGAFTWESKNVTADGVNVHFMHGFGWLVQMSENVYYYNCNLTPREGSGHITVSFADGIHASGAKGDLVIENCNFANTHDDPINLHGTFTRVEQRRNDHTLQLKYIHTQQGGFPQYHVGDKVAFFTRDTLESTDNETLYTVAEVISNPGESGNDLRTMEVRFEETLPANLSDKIGWEPKYVAENVTYAPEVTIRNCTFERVPTRGILCTTRNKVLIEGNTFKNMSMATIYLSNDSDEWYESGPIRDMTIRNNEFYIKSIGRTAWEYAPAIYVHPVTKGGGLPTEDNPVHKNITIEGNIFHMDVDTVVKAESVENLTIRNNTILRTNPDISLQIAASKTTMLPGDRETLNTTATGDQHTRDQDNVYEFTKCKNVVLEGNTYDDGLKRYAVLSGMSDSNLTNNDDEIKVVYDRSQPAAPAVENIQYVSSSPDVLTVDANGRMTAKRAGTATVYAYYVWNGEEILSNSVEMTVEAEVPPEDVVSIQGGDDVVLTSLNETHTFQAEIESGKPVTWTVEDFATGGITDAAVIDENGVLTAKKNGVVWVKASSGLSTARKAVVISLPPAGLQLNKNLTITREDKTNYTMTADKVVIDMQSGDLWQTDNTVKNLFLYSVPETIDKDNLRTVIKVENMPVREENQWDTASFLLYNNDDNYISNGKKSHYDGIVTVNETNGSGTETGGSSTENTLTTAYLGFYKNGNTVSVDFKTENGTWTKVRDLDAAMLGDNYRIGFTAWESKDRGKTCTFSEFRVGSGELSYEELCAQPAIVFGTEGNQAPAASDAALDKAVYEVGETAAVNYTFTDADGDSEGRTLYCFSYDNGINEVTTEPEMALEYSGKVVCHVYPVDENGRPGTKVSTAEAIIGNIDLTEFAAAVAEAEKFDLSAYTDETAQAYRNALEDAKALLTRMDVTRAELDAALAAIADAKAALQEETVLASQEELAKLQMEVTDAAMKDLGAYTDETVQVYRDALAHAREVLKKENVTSAEVKEALGRLENAEKALEKKPAPPASQEREELQTEVEKAKADLSGYTEETAAVYKTALENAKRVLQSADATPEEIQRVLTELKKAEDNLKAKAPDDSSGDKKPGITDKTPVPAVGTVFEVKGIQYRITKSDAANGTAAAVKLTGKKKTKITIPAVVVKDGYTFKVTAINKNAFRKNKKVKTVVIGSNVTNIGEKAFFNCTKLKNITFKGKKAPKIGKRAFKGIAAKCKVTAPKKIPAKQFNKLKKAMKRAGVGKKAVYKKK